MEQNNQTNNQINPSQQKTNKQHMVHTQKQAVNQQGTSRSNQPHKNLHEARDVQKNQKPVNQKIEGQRRQNQQKPAHSQLAQQIKSANDKKSALKGEISNSANEAYTSILEETPAVQDAQVNEGNKKVVKITFLGGVGEIGKNMTAIEYDNEIVVIDCGLTFPGVDLPGVDLVVPDITYLLANRSKIKAIILTHGHEDHIGGLPYVLNDIKVPVYGSNFTLGLVENKLKEFPKIEYKTVTVKARNVLKIGHFSIEFIKVCHSIAGALALHITTPVGNIIHTGDFKIDFKPVDGVMTDLIRFGELGKKGVSLLLCESTNVCRAGYTMSESKVGEALDELFEKNKERRLFVATFASNIHRLQQIMDLAAKYKRKVMFSGRSMINVSETALKLGEIKFDKEILIDADKLDKFKDSELLIITTGSQGEPMSALTRMAAGNFNKVVIGENDTIIFSSSPIPGNEKSVYNVINELFKKGADVIYDELAAVHASGHACQEELKTIHALVNPKFFIPVHGEYRHLKRHEKLAMDLGMDKREIVLPDLGMQVEMGQNFIRAARHVPAGQRLIDGTGVGDMESSVLKDRMQLAEDGVCVVVINMSAASGQMNSDPFIITRGLVYDDEQEKFVAEAKAQIIETINNCDFRSLDPNEFRLLIRKAVTSYVFKKTKRRPVILTVLLNQ